MLFKNKTLAELIADFQKQVSERNQKINVRITTLEEEAGQIRADIEAETKSLVEHEMNDDKAAAEKAQKVIRKLNLRLVEVQDLIIAYRKELKSKGSYVRSLEKIRAAAAQERAVRQERINQLASERDEIVKKIEGLKNQLKQIEANISQAHIDAEVNTLKRIVKHIDPRAAALTGYREQERYLVRWIAGKMEAADEIIARNQKPEVPQEPEVIQLNRPLYNHVTAPQEQPEPKTVSRITTTVGEGTQYERLDEDVAVK